MISHCDCSETDLACPALVTHLEDYYVYCTTAATMIEVMWSTELQNAGRWLVLNSPGRRFENIVVHGA